MKPHFCYIFLFILLSSINIACTKSSITTDYWENIIIDTIKHYDISLQAIQNLKKNTVHIINNKEEWRNTGFHFLDLDSTYYQEEAIQQKTTIIASMVLGYNISNQEILLKRNHATKEYLLIINYKTEKNIHTEKPYIRIICCKISSKIDSNSEISYRYHVY